MAAVISSLAANGLKTLVVCEKKTPLDILYQKLGDTSSFKGWPANKFSIVLPDVEKRDKLVEKAQENGLSVDPLSCATIAKNELISTGDIRRLENEISRHENSFSKHRTATMSDAGFGMSFQDAVAWTIDYLLLGHTAPHPR